MAIALLGGTAALGWNLAGENAGLTPTLLASSDPIKIKPKNSGGKIVPNQDQAVYQSVDGNAKTRPKQQRLKDDSEQPITVASVKTTVVGMEKTENRVESKDGDTIGGLAIQPRRVRTVVVKPDGTIVSSTRPSGDNSYQNGVKIIAPKLALKPEMQETLATGHGDILTAKSNVRFTSSPNEETVRNTVKTKAIDAAEAIQKKVAIAKIAPKPLPVKAAVKTPVAEKPARVSSPFAVQISSQRSAAAANTSYTNMSKRYARIIGGKGVDIKKATVQGKGVYYRVRIPAQTRSEANNICSRLKSVGGDCFVTR